MKRNNRLNRTVKTAIVSAAFFVIGAMVPAAALASEREVVSKNPEITVIRTSEEEREEYMTVTTEILLNEGKPIVINEIPEYCY